MTGSRRNWVCFAFIGWLISLSQPAFAADDPEQLRAEAEVEALYQKFPDVPRVPILKEMGGIKIPRMKAPVVARVKGAKIPQDVGNPAAKGNQTPVDGGQVVVRLNSEPRSMNPIIETSAVRTYISEYFLEPLAKQNPETFEYEPKLASKWVAEDSVRLAADYPGSERRLQPKTGGKGEPQAEFEYPKVKRDEKKPPSFGFVTTDANGKALADVWVGAFPADPAKMPGAPAGGYHLWSNAAGEVSFSGLVAGKYRVRVGAEIYGQTETSADGKTTTVTPATAENPLHQVVGAAKKLTLKSEQVADLQKQVVYTFQLRPEAQWSDGVPFTAADLEFAYQLINNAAVDGESIRTYYQDVVECRPLTPHVLRLKFRQQYFKAFEFAASLSMFTPPLHLFEELVQKKTGATLTLQTLTPAEEKTQNKLSASGETFGELYNTAADYNAKPLGNGPYQIESWDRGNTLRLVRNPKYWDSQDRGHLDRLIFRFIADNVTAMTALKSGDIDFMFLVTPEQFFQDLKGPPEWLQQNFVKAEWFTPAYSYVGWNLLRPQFQDRQVRLALRMLFNVEEFIDKKLYGAAIPIAASQYALGPGHDHSLRPIAYAPETAKDLLSQAGWLDTDRDGLLDKKGKSLSFELYMPPGNKTIEDQATLLQKAYKGAGIKMEINFLEWASFIEKVKSKDFDVCRLSWAMDLESDPYQTWHSSGAGEDKRGSNHVSYRNPLGDRLIEMLRVTLDLEKRRAIHYSFERLLDAEQPYLFLYAPKDLGLYHQRYRGVKWYPLRPGFDLREWWTPAAM